MNRTSFLAPLVIALVGSCLNEAMADGESIREATRLAIEAVRNQRPEPAQAEEREEHQRRREQLRDDLRDQLEQLGPTADRDEIDRLVNEFQRQHRDEIDAQTDAAGTLASDSRDEIPDEVDSFLQTMRRLQEERQRAQQTHQVDRAAEISEEARRELHEQFLTEQHQIHQSLKEAVKEFRHELRVLPNLGGRRVSD
ncbi:MAG: hypothetical protein ACI8T1_002307 [Verrucomicrobiales bacterium]|jgi:hypothetical protein